MDRRAWRACLGLLLALLALVALSPVPAALAADSASPAASPSASASAAPEGTPIVLGTVPDPRGGNTNWTGDRVQVNFDPNGAELDAAECTLFVNGAQQELSADPSIVYLAPSNPTLQYLWDKAYSPGEYTFKVQLVTTEGVTVEHEWPFASEGSASGGSLINFSVMKQWFWYIAAGAIVTVELTVVSIALACVFALLGALGRLSKKMSFKQAWDRYQSREYMVRMVFGRIPYWVATFYTSLFRGTPLLLQIYVIYLGSPEVIRALGLPDTYNPSPFLSGVAALSLNYGAYLTEVFRAGIQAVPRGQNEAAWAIGLSGWQTQRRIVLPQAFKIVIPAIGNDFIALIKDTSLVSVITVEELLRRAQLAGASSLNFFSTLLVAAAFYWALTIFFSFWQAKLETSMARDKAREKEKGRK